jgi:hypothetical protein
MKFHGRVAAVERERERERGRGGELEYHDSLHLPRLKRLFLLFKTNQLYIIVIP